MICPFIVATPYHTQTISYAVTRAETNHIDGARLAPLSMNELTTEYWNSYAIWNSL